MNKTLFFILILFTGTLLKAQHDQDYLYSVWQDQNQSDSTRAAAFKEYIWGDAVNIASRLENYSEQGKVNISQPTYDLLKNETQFELESRGKVDVKGKGEIEMWFVNWKAKPE